jgi:hypothetical protein
MKKDLDDLNRDELFNIVTDVKKECLKVANRAKGIKASDDTQLWRNLSDIENKDEAYWAGVHDASIQIGGVISYYQTVEDKRVQDLVEYYNSPMPDAQARQIAYEVHKEEDEWVQHQLYTYLVTGDY